MTNEERTQEALASQEIGVTPTSADAFGQRARRFDALVGEYRSLSETIEQLELEQEKIHDTLKNYFTDSDIKTVLVDNAKVTLVQNKGRSTIDKVKLIEHGVPASTIVECTLTGNPFSFVKVTLPKSRLTR